MQTIRRRWRRSLVTMSAMAFLAGSCESSTAPGPVEGVFVLRTVGGVSVPAVTGAALNTVFSTLADTVTLRADGSGEWVSVTSRADAMSGVTDTARTTKEFEYVRGRRTVTAVDISCEPNCDVMPNQAQFIHEGDWLTRGPGPMVWRYERVGPDDGV